MNTLKTAVFDVDGVLSTGQFIYSAGGKIYKIFGPHDNDGIKILQKHLTIKFVTADHRGFPISKKRIVDDMGCSLELVSELERFDYISSRYGLSETVYMGDGIFDVPILRACEFSIAPKNARKEALAAAKFVTENISGSGAVLDACQEIVRRYFQ
jgi:3-deoxy-D-manno-octulosonate 8-phosphate phosphatase (KDO 8-P phosphatase)